METIFGASFQSASFILLANSILCIILLIIVLKNTLSLRSFKRKYAKFMSAGFNEKNLEQLIDACLFKSEDVLDKQKDIQDTITKIQSDVLKCIQKIGFTRYSAFENVGGDQSFSIAILDSIDNGIVLTGIHNRDSSSVYAKLIENGKSKYTLTADEIQAIDRAIRSHGERFYTDSKSVS